jgi:hypothetical protein
MTKDFMLREGETWRNVVIRIAVSASMHMGDDRRPFVHDCLATFDAAIKKRNGDDDRGAALVALHRWACFPRTEHTPGPWTWAKMDDSTTMLLGEGQDPCCTSILIADGCKACADKGRNCSINGNEFDLSLIAAAPDLLAACKALDKLCCEQSFSTTELARVLGLACVAIGKAEGRP